MSTNPMNAMEIHGDRHSQPAAGACTFVSLSANCFWHAAGADFFWMLVLSQLVSFF